MSILQHVRRLVVVVLAAFVLPVHAQSSCPGFIPSSITTPAHLVTAINAAQGSNCPGVDWIDLNGNTITFTAAGFTFSAENVALPVITTQIELRDGTLTRSSATGFRLLAASGGRLILRNMTLSNGGGSGITTGGAVYANGTAAVDVFDSTFNNNTASGSGGAISTSGSGAVRISDSLFQGNSVGTYGGALHIYSTEPLTVSRSRFFGNSATIGAAIAVGSNGPASITNTLIAGNAGHAVGLIGGTDATFINTTIVGSNGAGVSVNPAVASHVYRNSLIWGNRSGSLAAGAAPPTTITHTAAQGVASATISTGETVEDFFVNPLAVPGSGNTGLNYNPALYNWTLRPYSQALDRGDNAVASATDLAGQPRLFDDPYISNNPGTVDLGAYERQTVSCSDFTFPYTLAGATNTARSLNLRDAVRCANTDLAGAADIIDLAGQTVSYSRPFTTDTALPMIDSELTLRNGIIERDPAASNFRLIVNNGTLALQDMTLRNGSVAPTLGGAIHSFGPLTIERSTLANNSAEAGGAIASQSTLVVARSTFIDNTAQVGGGAVSHVGAATFDLSNSTVTGNVAGAQGAIFTTAASTLTVTNSTIVANSATNFSGGIHSSGTTFLRNSILADNTPRDCYRAAGAVNFEGTRANIVMGDDTASNACGMPGQSYVAVSPQLGALTGLPAYFPLLATSPAIDAGLNSALGGATVDQPGNPRVQSDIVDLGSHESPFDGNVIALQFASATSSASEAAGFGALLHVTTNDGLPTPAAATVTVTVTGGTATAADYNRTGTITVPAGTANNALVSIASGITVTNETLVEPNETMQLSITAPVGASLGAQLSTTHTITNDDTATVTIGSLAQDEGNSGQTTMTFQVAVNNPVQGGFALDFTTTDLSATAGNDYVNAAGTLVFSGLAGETQSIPVTINGDTTLEDNETFRVSFPSALASVAPGSLIITATGIGTIRNDDSAAITIENVSQAEGNSATSTMTFAATLDNTVQGAFTVNYAVSPDTATVVDADYQVATGTLVFSGAAGQTQTFTVTINGDNKVEPDETFNVALTGATNPHVDIVTAAATGTIVNDDSATLTIGNMAITEGNTGTSNMIFTATLDNPVQGGFTVNYTTADDTATTADNDYVSATGTLNFTGAANQTRTFVVAINGDTKVEANETFTVSLNTVSKPDIGIVDVATGTINNNDTAAVTIANVSQPENGTFTFTASLNNATAAPFSVDWQLAAGTTSASDYVGDVLPTGGTLTFSGTLGETRTFTVPVRDDTVVEPTETFTISLGNVVTTGGFVVNTADTAIGTITNNDTAAITIADASIAEGDSGSTLLVFSATLNNAVQGGFTVNYATTNGTAMAGSDYVAATGTLTFAGTAGERQDASVTINGDTAIETNETFSFALNTVSNAAVTISDTAIGTILNDDVAGYVVDTTNTAASISEPTSSTSFTIRLIGAPSGTVIVDFNSTDLTECAVSPAAFTFNASNWNVAQTITISAVDDLVADGLQACSATITRTGGTAPQYTSLANPSNVNVTVADNDIVGITVAPTTIAIPISESGGTVSVAINANTAPTGTVNIPLTTNGQCEVDTGNGFSSAETVTLPAGSIVPRSVSVRAVNDTVIDGVQTCAITTGNPTSATDAFYDALTAAEIADITATVTDNDVLHTVAAGIGGSEGTGIDPTYSFTIVRNGATNVASSVDYAVFGSGVVGVDYHALNPATDITGTGITATATSIFFAAHATTATVTVTVRADSIVEPDFALTLSLNGAQADVGAGTGSIAGSPASLTITDDDVAGYVVDTTGTAASVAEPSASTTFAIRLVGEPAGTVVLDFGSTDATECAVSPAAFTFNAGNWNTAQTITIAVADDLIADGTQPCAATITRSASSTAAEYAGVANPANVALVVTDNEIPGITVDPTLLAISESGDTATFGIRANSQPTGNLTVPITTDAQCEVDTGSGFSAAEVLTLPAGSNTPRTVTVRAVNDTVIEDAHTCAITTGNPTSATDAFYDALTAADVADVIANVADNDVLHTAAAGAGGAEGTGVDPTYSFTITRSGSTDIASSVDYTLGGSAVAGTDYIALNPATDISGTGITATATTISFAANATTATLTVTVNADSIVESDVSIALALANPTADGGAGTGTVAGSPASLTVTDDDVAGYAVDTTGTATSIAEPSESTTFTMQLVSEPAGVVIVDLGSTDPSECTVSPASITFAAGNWNTAQIITIAAADDMVADGTQPCAATITRNAASTAAEYAGVANPADIAVSVADDDVPGVTVAPITIDATEGGTDGSYTVVLNTQPTDLVTIAVNGDTQTTASPSTLQFTDANWNLPQTVTVTAIDDAVAEGPHTGTITHAASGADYAGIAVADVGVTITDDETAGIVVTPTPGLETTESGSSASFNVALSSLPAGAVTIALSSDDSSEGTVSPGTLSFDASNWNVAQSVTITGIDDAIADGDQPYSIVLAAAVSTDRAYDGIDADDVSVTNTDNDAAGIIVTPTAGLETTEAGGTAAFTVVLASEPTAAVAIALSSSDTSEGTFAPAALAFDATNWNIAQTVTVTGVDDAIGDGDIAYTIVTAAAVSTDPSYDGFDVADVAISNRDDDSLGVTITPTTVTATEGGSGGSYSVVLDSEPTGDVSIAITSDAEVTTTPASLQFTAANWNIAQTVTVTAVDDAVAEGNHAGTIAHAASGADYAGAAVASVAVDIVDNDTGGIVVTPSSGLETTEAGGTATFTVVLASEPTATVSITLSSSDTSEGTVAPAALVFDATNWNIAQIATVTGVDDAIVDGDVAYSIVLAAAVSTDPGYDGRDADDVAVTNADDDASARLAASKRVTQIGTVTQPVVYEIVVRNDGSADQADAAGSDELIDVLPSGLALRSASASAGDLVTDIAGNTVRWNGGLAIGATVTLQITADVIATETGPISNQATLNYDSNGDGSNDASALSDDPTTPGTDATVFEFNGGGTAPSGSEPAVIPTLDLRALLALVFCIGLLGGGLVRRRGV